MYDYGVPEMFPTLYRNKGFPFECGDGWFMVIFKLSQDICAISEYVYAVQVKEKFGSMRFYVEFEYDSRGICLAPIKDQERIMELIWDAESKTQFMCIECGKEKTRSSLFCKDCRQGH
jgi:hypothetical protein